MLSIYVNNKDSRIITADNGVHKVRLSYILKNEGLTSLRDIKPSSKFEDVTIKLCKRIYNKEIVLSQAIKTTILHFMLKYHAKTNLSFDCYDLACRYKGIDKHDKIHLLKYWNISILPIVVPIGSVVFFIDPEPAYFHHAAIYIGNRIYLSVYGPGGNLEFSTLKSMRESFKTRTVVLASSI